jgi:hypothetical protein
MKILFAAAFLTLTANLALASEPSDQSNEPANTENEPVATGSAEFMDRPSCDRWLIKCEEDCRSMFPEFIREEHLARCMHKCRRICEY